MNGRRFRAAAVVVAVGVGAACAGDSDVTSESSDTAVADAADTDDAAATSADTGTDSGNDAADDGETSDSTGAADALDWTPCGTDVVALPTECATLEVPRDHGDPEGETISIRLSRLDTASGDRQIGSLLANPGGPGGSGVDFVAQLAVIIPAEVQERFDIVSFDPRGVGLSTGLDCVIDIDDNVTLLAEGDDAGWQELVDDALAQPDECTDETLELAPFVGTNNAARDLDLIREALGDDGLTYVGYSYGTRLGATYAALFPENVRALVLDAAVAPTDDFAELDRVQATGFDRALRNFATECDADPDCELQELGPTLDVIEGLRDELAEVGSFPTDDGDRVLTPGELDLGIAASLYSKDTWPFLAQALFVAEVQQDGTLLQVLGDALVGRQPDGSYDNSSTAGFFINCADDPNRPPVDEIRAQADETAAQSEFFSDFQRATTGCLGAPDAIDSLLLDPAADAPPLLVLGNTGDPATPYEWSIELSEFLATAVLYTVEAEGHTAYGTIDCVEDVVNRYLIDLEVPDEGGSCSDNADADFFPPAGEGQLAVIVSLFDCLRDNGLDVPELTEADILADPSGETYADALDPNDPAFQDAALACLDELDAVAGSL
ncbi:MAG: alpha/beta hydrolase [Actinomycetota bacterium]